MKSGRKPISPDGARKHRITVNVTDPLFEGMVHFVDPQHDQRFHGSRNELIEAALKFYFKQYHACQGELDENLFPVTRDGPPEAPRVRDPSHAPVGHHLRSGRAEQAS